MVKKKTATEVVRKPRADAERNRIRILEVAKEIFTAQGANASLDEIAKQAEVGPGTLYRHFPTRTDLLTAVYQSEVIRLGEMQRQFSAEMKPLKALKSWLLLFGEYLEAKQIIWPAIQQNEDAKSAMAKSTGGVLENAIGALVQNAVKSGDVRKDVSGMDLLMAVYGLSLVKTGTDWKQRMKAIMEILIQGSRP